MADGRSESTEGRSKPGVGWRLTSGEFGLMKHHRTVHCYSNSFVGRNLPASALDCESVSGFKRFLDGHDYISRES